MKVLKGMGAAFSMFSIVPVTTGAWDRETLQTMLGFLPLVGVAVGLAQLGWIAAASWLGLSGSLTAVVLVFLPIVISGGVHLDGLADTFDAIGSHAPKERRLEIMSDSTTGAFGVMGIAGYFLMSYGLWRQVLDRPYLLTAALTGPVAARTMGALVSVLVPKAKSHGLTATFSDAASKKWVVAAGAGYLLAATGFIARYGVLWAVASLAGTILMLCCASRYFRKAYGGVTGDLAGWLICMSELYYLTVAALGGVLL